MKIAIHKSLGSFSDDWISFCESNNISYKIVDAFDNDIIQQLNNCSVFLWHHHQSVFEDTLVAKSVLFALQQAGIKVFPDFNTGWHFDDKVAQKYLLEAIKAPLVPSYVFYDKKKALDWIEQTSFPKVFKLKGGAGASNVKLVKDKQRARKLINKAFGRGFPQFNSFGLLKDKISKFRAGKGSFLSVLKGIGRLVIPTDYNKKKGKEIGYAYFQEFIPNNNFDTRVVVVGDRAVAERRMVRENDFRASGSGIFEFDNINLEAIKIAFDVSNKLKLQSVAFDFVEDSRGNPLIVEMSYGFGTIGLNNAPGYWDSSLIWHNISGKAQEWIMENILRDK